jgi:hypothetical protein
VCASLIHVEQIDPDIEAGHRAADAAISPWPGAAV